MGVFRKEVWVSNVIWQLSQTTPSLPSPKCKKISIWPEPLQYAQGPAAAAAKSLQSCPTLYDLRDSSPPGSAIPGILQARTLEWVAISFSRHAREPSLLGYRAQKKSEGVTQHIKEPWDLGGFVPWNAHSLKTCAVPGPRAQTQDTEPLFPKSLPNQTRNEPGSAFMCCVSSKNPLQEWEKPLTELGGHWPYCWSTYNSVEEVSTLPTRREQKAGACVRAQSLQSCLTLFDPMDCSPPDQAPPSMGFSRQEYWSGSPCLSPRDLPNPGIEPESPAMKADSLPLSHCGSPWGKGMLQKFSSFSFHVPGVFQDVTGMVCTLL